MTPSAASANQSPQLVVPASFQPADQLRGADRRLGDHVGYLLHCIRMRRVSSPREERDGYMPLSAEPMKLILGTRGWPKAKGIAIDYGYVECDGSYSVGRRSMGYRLLPPYSVGSYEWRGVMNRALAHRISEWRESHPRRIWEECQRGDRVEQHRHLWRHLQRVRLDGPITETLDHDAALAVELIRRGEWRWKVDDYGRLHTNLTNLWKPLRKYLRVDGRRLVEIDIACSQPLFLGMRVREMLGETAAATPHALDTEIAKEADHTAHTLCGVGFVKLGNLQQYMVACEAGEFYWMIGAEAGLDVEYDTLKKRTLTAVYNRPNHRNKVTGALERRFPVVADALAELKQGDYRHASHEMQRMEGQAVIGDCVRRLCREHPDMFIATIHDSVLAVEGDEDIVVQAMQDVFRTKYHVTPTLRCK